MAYKITFGRAERAIQERHQERLHLAEHERQRAVDAAKAAYDQSPSAHPAFAAALKAAGEAKAAAIRASEVQRAADLAALQAPHLAVYPTLDDAMAAIDAITAPIERTIEERHQARLQRAKGDAEIAACHAQRAADVAAMSLRDHVGLADVVLVPSSSATGADEAAVQALNEVKARHAERAK